MKCKLCKDEVSVGYTYEDEAWEIDLCKRCEFVLYYKMLKQHKWEENARKTIKLTEKRKKGIKESEKGCLDLFSS